MIDWTKPIEGRDGRAARVLATDLPGDFPYAVAWEVGRSNWHAEAFSLEGAERSFCNKPVKREGWVKVMRRPIDGHTWIGNTIHGSKEDALLHIEGAHSLVVAAVRIEWEE